MKKIFTIILTLLIGAGLAGCSESKNTQDTIASGASDETLVAAETSGFELALGSLKLEETDLAINVDQAQDLIPLWQAYAALSQSDITAQAELDAVVKQILNAMTEEQMELINSWGLSAQDMQSILSEYDIEIGRGNGDGTGQEFDVEDMPEGFEPGQGMGGGQGLGPGGGMGGAIAGGGAEPPAGVMPGDLTGTMDADTLATMEANRAQRTEGMNFLPIGLINALIEVLQAK